MSDASRARRVDRREISAIISNNAKSYDDLTADDQDYLPSPCHYDQYKEPRLEFKEQQVFNSCCAPPGWSLLLVPHLVGSEE